VSYVGPRKIVVIGGGIAGLAAADAISEALANYDGPLPDGMSVTLLEGERAFGGRASSAQIAEQRSLHPHGPHRVDVPHGIHFVWGCYRHFERFCAGATPFSPRVGTPTYCAWMAPPDVRGPETGPGKIVAVHVCDPERPDSAWDPRARALLRAMRDVSRAAGALRSVLKRALNLEVYLDDYLSYADILFADRELAPELRWRIFLAGVFASVARQPETSHALREMLRGRDPTDADIGEIMRPAFDFVVPRIRHAARSVPANVAHEEPPPEVAPLLGDGIGAAVALSSLVARDAANALARIATYHPKHSGYLKNILKAAFSSPYALDVATAIRDAQFGLRNYPGALLRTFDGDDSRAVFGAVRARIDARMDGARLSGGARAGRWVKKLVARGSTWSVETSAHVERPPAPVPTIRPATFGETSEIFEADAVVCTLLPHCAASILPRAENTAQTELLHSLRQLGRFMNETVNLQLFFPEKHALPFPRAREGETPPISISNIEGTFTIAVDLERAWSRDAFEAIRLREEDDGAFAGTAWELVGAWADMFTHDPHAHPSRYQWPLAIQQTLARLLHDPDDFVKSTLDDRPWVHDAHAPGRLAPPVMGEVKPERRAEYLRRWNEDAAPLIAAATMRQLAAMPGMAQRTVRYLNEEAAHVEAHEETGVCYTLVRNCQAENRFFSAEPGLFRLRPHARFESAFRGVFFAGDWTRNGLNLQSMEAAVISGLQAAHAILEQMRAGGLEKLVPPRIDPSILPDAAWDTGI
jgi:hypothetical protein